MIRSPKELWPHEQALVASGELVDVTHAGSKSHVFEAKRASPAPDSGRCCVYRHMGDVELQYVIDHNNQLPATQPYQTIVRGEEGFQYCKKYFGGGKRVDTDPTTILEFNCPTSLIDDLFSKFSKAEDGCMSHGLGDKAGKTLHLFNQGVSDGSITVRPVFVKRAMRKKK